MFDSLRHATERRPATNRKPRKPAQLGRAWRKLEQLEPRHLLSVSPPGIDIGATSPIFTGGTQNEVISITLPEESVVNKVDVNLLLDDTGSFELFAGTVKSIFNDLVAGLQAALPTVDFGFGVTRFEDYGGALGTAISGDIQESRPFILNQPIVTNATAAASGTTVEALVGAALDHTAPALGGDGPETTFEALYQIATGVGFDGNLDGNSAGSGPAGGLATQTSPGTTGDVPAFSTNVLPTSGSLGGVGWRSGSLRLVLLAGDIAPVAAFSGATAPAVITGAGGATEPFSAFTNPFGGRNGPVGTAVPTGGATVQAAVDALNALGIRVLSMGPGAAPTTSTTPAVEPSTYYSALARLTRAVDTGGTPLVFSTSVSSGELTTAIVNAISAAAALPIDIGLATSPLPAGLTFTNLTGVVNQVEPAETANFNVSFSGISEAGTFEIQFIDVVSNAVLDVIPVTVTPPPPKLSINDAHVVEGDSGTRNAVFTVSLNRVLRDTAITVMYQTTDVTAKFGSDYVFTSGQLTLPPGTISRTITVPVIGDLLDEEPEFFQVQLFNASVDIDRSIGIGTIIDDDALPALFVNDVQVTTTAMGTLEAIFTVALDVRSGRNVTVHYTTVDVTAHANVDYLPQSGTLLFMPGVNTLQVTVPVLTSDIYTPNELFLLTLSNPINANLGDPVGVCTSVFAPEPPPEYFIDDGDPGYTRTGNWTNVTNLIAYKMDYEYLAAGNGSGTATWNVHNLPVGWYEVFTKWVPFNNRATNAPYTVLDGTTPLGTVRVNQQLAPTGDWDNGIIWQSLGIYPVVNGALAVRLGNDANGYVIADAVRIVPNGIGAQTPEIDVSYADRSVGHADWTPGFEDGTAFGDVLATTDSVVHTFVIRNTGNADLHLLGSPAVQFVGLNPGDFMVSRQPATLVAPGRTTSFDVIFHPTTTGLRQAFISIASDDADEQVYQFAIEGNGTGGPIGSVPAQNVVQPLDVNADTLVSAWDALLVINSLLQQTAATTTPSALSVASAPLAQPLAATAPSFYLDVDGNGTIAPRDALLVINYLIFPPLLSTAAQSTAAASLAAEPTAGAAEPAGVQTFVLDTQASHPADPAAAAAELSASMAPEHPSAVAPAEPEPLLLTPESVDSLFAAGDESDVDEFAALAFD